MSGYKDKLFICLPHREFYSLEREVYVKRLESSYYSSFLYMTEGDMNTRDDMMNCNICRRRWNFISKKSELIVKRVCFCGKITGQFPCEACPCKYCDEYDCCGLVYGFSNKTKCAKHDKKKF